MKEMIKSGLLDKHGKANENPPAKGRWRKTEKENSKKLS